MPLPRLELETSGFDTMLGFMHQPDEPKSLSCWKEVGNPLILHNNPHKDMNTSWSKYKTYYRLHFAGT